MKTFTNVELEQIRQDLSNGVAYCGVRNTYCVGRIYSLNDGYIYFENYGQSAVKDTNEKLMWLLNVIFNDCETITKAFARPYQKARIFM